ncbi:predicted protein [Naegleria gruberi]|uniref:Predicted protein n=1 Tax=Naegleria gruberi TaxID=5762 RepID=D2VMQ8_NAEGR|nr:uncharacterized protein NAEGRDRAFT_50828 [Naegleria gruberi]EFC41776.1 predicted protein [Naegleria gruberi]|eukprot:XP_002674520.1 predicted protein [Naegleria gruberi strain NEG-M]
MDTQQQQITEMINDLNDKKAEISAKVEKVQENIQKVNNFIEDNQENIQKGIETANKVVDTVNTVLEKKEEIEKKLNDMQEDLKIKATNTLNAIGLNIAGKVAEKYKLKSLPEMMNSIQNIIPPAVLYGSVMRKPMLTQFGTMIPGFSVPFETIELIASYAFLGLLPFALFVSFMATQQKAKVDDELAKSNGSIRRHKKIAMLMSILRASLCGLAYTCYELFVGQVPTEMVFVKSYLPYMAFATFTSITGYEWLDAKIDDLAYKYLPSLVKKEE